MSNAAAKITGGLGGLISPFDKGGKKKSMLGGMFPADEMPDIAPPIEMPDAITDANAERRKSLRKQLKKKGRASTIMTQNNETL